jgi:hypothetical protein
MSQTETDLHPDDTITADDICSMAGRLIGSHGRQALEIAEYFAEENRLLGHEDQPEGWRAVRSLVSDILAGGRPLKRATVH